MYDLQEILERLELNEEIAKKFFEVEVSILSILNFKDLFEKLLTEIREKFFIPYVWISLIDENDISSLVVELGSSDLLKQRLNLLPKDTFLTLIGNNTKPILINKDLTPYYKLFPKNETYLIRSLAIAPITFQGEIIGSLNHGDPSPTRYSPGMDTTLLERLAVKVSICLANVAAHEKVRMAATRDPLTGLLNRRVLEGVLKREFIRAVRYGQPLSVVFMDLDDFKALNDTYGHDAGDTALRFFAQNLTRMCRESDILGRWGGDEFVLILPFSTHSDAKQLVSRLELFFKDNHLGFEGKTIRLSLSFGTATSTDAGVEDASALLRKADRSLYEDKKTKKKNKILSF